jgi:Lrp/AsnC family leucine-responsive transcriptional regulator
MKNIRPELIRLFKEGYCTPQISKIAKTTNEPSTTIYYNIKKLEKEGAIRAYKAVFDHDKIDEGFSAFLLLSLSSSEFAQPESVAHDLAKYREVESIDVIAGDWELLLKIRTKNQDAYFEFLKTVVSKEQGIENTNSIISLREIKSEFITALDRSKV